MTPKELVRRSVTYARYFQRRSTRNPDPTEVARLKDQATHCMKMARHIKAAAVKTGSYA